LVLRKPPVPAGWKQAISSSDSGGSKQLNIDLSGRYDHYSDFGSAFTEGGIQFTPIEECDSWNLSSRIPRAVIRRNGSSSAEGSSPNSCRLRLHQYVRLIACRYSVGVFSLANPTSSLKNRTLHRRHHPAAIKNQRFGGLLRHQEKNVIEPPDTAVRAGHTLRERRSWRPVVTPICRILQIPAPWLVRRS